jgi:hypothetical protein
MLILLILACILPTQTTRDDTNKHSTSVDDTAEEAPG